MVWKNWVSRLTGSLRVEANLVFPLLDVRLLKYVAGMIEIQSKRKNSSFFSFFSAKVECRPNVLKTTYRLWTRLLNVRLKPIPRRSLQLSLPIKLCLIEEKMSHGLIPIKRSIFSSSCKHHVLIELLVLDRSFFSVVESSVCSGYTCIYIWNWFTWIFFWIFLRSQTGDERISSRIRVLLFHVHCVSRFFYIHDWVNIASIESK